ncbi:MAG: hypothetical protein U5K51_03510 [Flavobacteriaceae bacterium]|nr:hypothetical protein [Flavobacteriaceae bacterium]
MELPIILFTSKLFISNAALLDAIRINNFAVNIPETNYWMTGVGFLFIQWVATTSTSINFDVECLAGEGKGLGYYDIYSEMLMFPMLKELVQ